MLKWLKLAIIDCQKHLVSITAYLKHLLLKDRNSY
jgi:hypothetical protein